MTGKGPAARSYRSPLRERQVTQTRELILRALAEQIVDAGLHGVSVAAVAARAEVAERTVYRHFPNVEALLAGLRALVGEQLGRRMAGRPRLAHDLDATVDEIIEAIPALYGALDAIGTPARAAAIVTLEQGDDPDRSERRAAVHRALRPELSHLDDETAAAVIDTMYVLAGSVSWFLLTRDRALTGAAAGTAAAHVLRATVAGLRAERRRAERARSG